MLKKILLGIFLMSLTTFLFAGAEKEEAAKPAAVEEKGPEVEEEMGSGIPYKAPISIGTKNFTEPVSYTHLTLPTTPYV